jgi:hypothetical protein
MPCTRVADRAMPWAHSLDGGPSSVSRNLSVPPSAELAGAAASAPVRRSKVRAYLHVKHASMVNPVVAVSSLAGTPRALPTASAIVAPPFTRAVSANSSCGRATASARAASTCQWHLGRVGAPH